MAKRVWSEFDLGELTTVSATEEYGKNLDCFSCHDKSLYHDSFAYWNNDKDDLLCENCFGKLGAENQTGYQRVLTFH